MKQKRERRTFDAPFKIEAVRRLHERRALQVPVYDSLRAVLSRTLVGQAPIENLSN